MHVALVSPTFHPEIGGAETYTRWVLDRLAERGADVDVVAGARAGVKRRGAVGAINVFREGPPRGAGSVARARWLPGFTRAAVRRLRTLAPDAVLAQYSGLVAAGRHARRAGLPLTAIVHDVYGFRENLRHRGVAPGAARYLVNDRLLALVRPDTVVAVSEAAGAGARGLTRAPVAVARPGADHVPEGPEPDGSSLQVLFIGRTVRSKGIDDAARAVYIARGEVPGARLLVVGTGPWSRRMAWIEVREALDELALDHAYRSSAVLVFPSHREGWGLAVTEAAARGLVYVAYDIPAVREQHLLLQGGVLVAPGDVGELARALARLLGDADLRRRLGTIGREHARLLRWSDAAERVEGCLRAAMERRRMAR